MNFFTEAKEDIARIFHIFVIVNVKILYLNIMLNLIKLLSLPPPPLMLLEFDVGLLVHYYL